MRDYTVWRLAREKPETIGLFLGYVEARRQIEAEERAEMIEDLAVKMDEERYFAEKDSG